jgi:hypothetical protein
MDLNLIRQCSELEDCGQFNSELTDTGQFVFGARGLQAIQFGAHGQFAFSVGGRLNVGFLGHSDLTDSVL